MSEEYSDERNDFVQVRVPKGMVAQIDALIEQKKFSSRSEFFKRIAAE